MPAHFGNVCTGASGMPRAITLMKVPARDCTRKGYAASVTLVPRERLRYHVAVLLAMTDQGGFLCHCEERSDVAIYFISCTELVVPAPAYDMSPPYREVLLYSVPKSLR